MSKIESIDISKTIEEAWDKIALTPPLENLTPINYLSYFDKLPLNEALKYWQIYFNNSDLPCVFDDLNKETIKWLQVFFDEGMSPIKIPFKNSGLLKSVMNLLKFDKKVVNNKLKWYLSLPKEPIPIIEECLIFLDIKEKEICKEFFILMLTTLHGWSGYIKYKYIYHDKKEENLYIDYITLRTLLITLICNDNSQINNLCRNISLKFRDDNITSFYENQIKELEKKRNEYTNILLEKITKKKSRKQFINTNRSSCIEWKAQFVFCMDTRSESFRRSMENQGKYETYSCAGFFDLPLSFNNKITNKNFSNCPLHIKPLHEFTINASGSSKKKVKRRILIDNIYKLVEYNFLSPFALHNSIGLLVAALMIIKCFFPYALMKIIDLLKDFIDWQQNNFDQTINSLDLISIDNNISFKDQYKYAYDFLCKIGLTRNFSPVIILCSHIAETTNIPFSSSFNCAACRGNNGLLNAFVLATILNKKEIRLELEEDGIFIPDNSFFAAAEHNTSIDIVKFFHSVPKYIIENLEEEPDIQIANIEEDFIEISKQNAKERFIKICYLYNEHEQIKIFTNFYYGKIDLNIPSYKLENYYENPLITMQLMSQDWAQNKQEIGFIGNSSFIVAPRELTKDIDLDGRSFLHSYDWKIDKEGKILSSILGSPMLISYSINSQYLLATLDNISFGAGNKNTLNITGHIGFMQGNASDLMNGIPFQTIFKTNKIPFYEPIRIISLIYAPRELVIKAIKNHNILQNLLKNNWIKIIIIDPINQNTYLLSENLKCLLF